MFKKGFTLAEALITLTIIGVIATMVIPSTVSNHRKTQYNASLKKAVKGLNEVITMNIAKGHGTAFKSDSLYDYLQLNMDVISSTTNNSTGHQEILTSDGMRYEIPNSETGIYTSITIGDGAGNEEDWDFRKGSCGTKDLGIGGSSRAIRDNQPCVIMIDVNGEKKPNRLSTANEVFDRAFFLVTDQGAIPYGNAAQKAFYNK